MPKETVDNSEQLTAFVQDITKKAGNILLDIYEKKSLKQRTKEDLNSIVTEADEAANRFLIDTIKDRYPSHGIISEEENKSKSDIHHQYVWVIDPLDGTVNYSTHNPLFGNVIALLHKKEILTSAIYLPILKELYFAQRGKGAYLNGERILCSRKTTLAHTIGCIPSHNKEGQWPLYMYEHGCKNKCWVNALGSAAVMGAFVAAGRRDWYVSSDKDVWDLAAQVLLMQEAGCVVTDSYGGPWSFESTELVAANKQVHQELLALVQVVKKQNLRTRH